MCLLTHKAIIRLKPITEATEGWRLLPLSVETDGLANELRNSVDDQITVLEIVKTQKICNVRSP